MSAPKHEIEVKLAFDSPESARRKLERSGARREGRRQFEDNVLFDRAPAALEPVGKLLRLRRVGREARLTFKAPVPGSHAHKVREEAESAVSDPGEIERILAGLGFAPVYRYQKYRTHYRLGQLEIALDETPIGCFVELEGPGEEIDRVAAGLGFTRGDYLLDSYQELHRRWAKDRGAQRGDMVFVAGDGARG